MGHLFRPLHASRDHVLYNTFRDFNDIIFLFLPQMFQTSLAWWLKAFIRNLILCHWGQVGMAVSKAPDGSQRVALDRKMPEIASCFTSFLFIKMVFQWMCFYLYPAQTFPALCWRELVWECREALLAMVSGQISAHAFFGGYLLVWPQPWFVLAWHYLFSTVQK